MVWHPRPSVLIAMSAALGGCSPTPAPENPSEADIAHFATTMQELDTARQSYGIPGMSIAIVLDGRLAFSGAVGVRSLSSGAPVTPKTLFPSPVATRTLISATLLALEQDGKVDLGRAAKDYAPFLDFSGDSKAISTGLALTQRSGLAELGFRTDCTAGSASLADWFTSKGPVPTEAPPGAVFLSTTTGVAVGAAVIESVEQRPFTEVIRTRMLEPMFMRTATFDATAAQTADHAVGHVAGPDGELVEQDIDQLPSRGCEEWQASTGLFASARDHAQYLAGLLGAGGPLAPDSVQRMDDKLTDPGWGQSFGYGYLTISTEYKGVHFVSQRADAFGFQSFVGWIPERQFGVVLLANGPGSLAENYALNLMIYELADRFLGLNGDPPDDLTSPASWGKYAGSYQVPENPALRFDVGQSASGELSLKTPSSELTLTQGYPDQPFTGGDTFVSDAFQGTFFTDASGNMKYLAGRSGDTAFVAERVQ